MKGKNLDGISISIVLHDVFMASIGLFLSSHLLDSGDEWYTAYVIGITAFTYVFGILSRRHFLTKYLRSVTALQADSPAQSADKSP